MSALLVIQFAVSGSLLVCTRVHSSSNTATQINILYHAIPHICQV